MALECDGLRLRYLLPPRQVALVRLWTSSGIRATRLVLLMMSRGICYWVTDECLNPFFSVAKKRNKEILHYCSIWFSNKVSRNDEPRTSCTSRTHPFCFTSLNCLNYQFQQYTTLLLVGGHPLRPQSCSETGWLGMFMCNSWWPVCYTFLPLCENLYMLGYFLAFLA